jgi:hypothetical protein
MTPILRFDEWLHARDCPPDLDPTLVARLKAALPLDPLTTGIAQSESELWLIAAPRFKSLDRGAARLTLRRLVGRWKSYRIGAQNARAKEQQRALDGARS